MSEQEQFHEAIMNGLEKLDQKVDLLRTESIPEIHTRMALVEVAVKNLKEDVRKEAKRDAKIYGGIGSAVASMIAIVLGYRH